MTYDHRAYMRKYRINNAESVRVYQREWRAENFARVRDYSMSQQTRDTRNARKRARYASDPTYRVKVLTDRTRWSIRPEDATAFCNMYGEDCFYCGNKGGTVDHLLARSKGGVDELYNLVPACQACNSRKHNRSLADFYAMA